ncbi:Na+/H+ antiporter subunit G [candidate division WOR-3 bacterium]|uniref:Na+/H+ antiporter subunit G n=1 Tax=candidate division WOR-3 bacterium TaxID=2052148 RepID=A0A9D5K8F0_UNCW3|nr:Na+/H+ antiporter subunit G [candidate division WOR-3 bacterium]MBD3364237.1 Na+/H+ antiporter subunit G [candidate division WOR-3 bacterium]
MAIVGYIVITVGVLFDLLGAVGLVRLPDIYNRLQSSTKSVTLGTFGIMIGILIVEGFSPIGIKALICGVFLLLTAPVSAHALSRGSLRFGAKMWKGTVIDSYGSDKLGGPQIESKEKEDEVAQDT